MLKNNLYGMETTNLKKVKTIFYLNLEKLYCTERVPKLFCDIIMKGTSLILFAVTVSLITSSNLFTPRASNFY